MQRNWRFYPTTPEQGDAAEIRLRIRAAICSKADKMSDSLLINKVRVNGGALLHKIVLCSQHIVCLQ